MSYNLSIHRTHTYYRMILHLDAEWFPLEYSGRFAGSILVICRAGYCVNINKYHIAPEDSDSLHYSII